ncbi:WD repeat-containing protein 43-like [Glandiceps talaboti]
MATTACPCGISPNAELLALCSPDGRLKIWETATSSLKQQYTPSSHLSATCTCLSWEPLRARRGGHKKKKRKSSSKGDGVDVAAGGETVNLIAFGTSVGSILLYSLVKGDLQSQMDGGHDDTVNCLCWHSEDDTLYSCSDDCYIVEWSITTGTVKCKWKGDKHAVHSICLCPGGRNLLSAGRKIKLWDLEKKEVLKRYTGHASPISQLSYVPLLQAQSRRPSGDDQFIDVEGLYFLSSAIHDRVLNAWQVRSEAKDKHSVAAFSLIEEPVNYDVSRPSDSDQTTFIAVVTRSGQVQIFDPVLNGKTKKPIKPRCSIQVATQGNKEITPKPIPILCAQFCSKSPGNILIAYGTLLKPVFEEVYYLQGEPEICLIREDSAILHVKQNTSVNKVKTPLTSDEVKVVHLHHSTPVGPSQTNDDARPDQKKKRKTHAAEVSMEDRLNAISIASHNFQQRATQVPQTDSLVLLLTQGLQSQDKEIIERVLNYSNETLIRNTVSRLPVQMVLPLAEQLTVRINKSAERGTIILRWVKALFTIHTSYLSTFPEIIQKLSVLYQMMDQRIQTYSKLSRLQGKVSLMMSQITSQAEEAVSKTLNTKPLMVYQEDSSDEQEEIEELMRSHSESEGEWEQLSDMDADDADDDDDDNEDEEEMESHDGDDKHKDDDDDDDDEEEDDSDFEDD